MRTKINVLIVDDEVLIRQGLMAIMEKENFIDAIYEANDEESFLHKIAKYPIDVILLDIRLGHANGIELLKKSKILNPNLKVIAVTGLDGVELIINLLREGVHGIVYKLDGYEEIRNTIRAVIKSESYFPKNILKIIQVNANKWEQIPPVLLSTAERTLLNAIARGITTKEIANELKMSPTTAETYRVRLMHKVGVSNTAALLAYAYRNGIL